MSKLNLAQLPGKMYELLEPLSPEDRELAVRATMILFGQDINFGNNSHVSQGVQISSVGNIPTISSSATGVVTAVQSDIQEYISSKNPKNKGELLATVAYFREENNLGEAHTKEDLKQLIKKARMNFDDKNFARDMTNAKHQAGLFTKGSSKDGYALSFYGQQYIAALPDRDQVKKIKKPRAGATKKKARSKK